MQFKDKVAIVTGGASGIGLATAKKLLAEGAKVVIGDVSKDLDNVIKSLGENAIGVYTDVSKESDVINLVNKAVNTFGHLDYMVANAGVGGSPNKLDDVSMEEWQMSSALTKLVFTYAINMPLKAC